MSSTTETGQAVWAQYQAMNLKPFTIRCISCKSGLERDEPAPNYLKLEEGDIEVFVPICRKCFDNLITRAMQDINDIAKRNEVEKVEKKGAA